VPAALLGDTYLTRLIDVDWTSVDAPPARLDVPSTRRADRKDDRDAAPQRRP
jgi:hypothetical protein